MVDILIPGYEQGLVAAIEQAVLLAFGVGTYRVRVDTDGLVWNTHVTYWERGKDLRGSITIDQATDPACRRILAQALCRAAARAGLLEAR